MLLSEGALRGELAADPRTTRVVLRRHLPSTLEIRIEPRRAVARLDAASAVDADGRRLGREHALAGLPLLHGFEIDGERMPREMRRILAAVGTLFEIPALVPSEVRLAGGDLVLLLADSGTRVRLDAERAEEQIVKLRIYEASLGGEPLPGSIDLRFQDQVVVAERGGDASRRAR
jgi:cell division septal protein FtsQ